VPIVVRPAGETPPPPPVVDIPTEVSRALRAPADPQHLAWPLRLLRNGTFATVEQESDAELLQNAALVLATSPGSRPGLPTFGFRDPTFSTTPPSNAEIEAAVREWDDRVSGVDTTTTRDGDVMLVAVHVRSDD